MSSRCVGAALHKQGERDAVCCDALPERSEGPRGRRGSGSPMTLTFPLDQMAGLFAPFLPLSADSEHLRHQNPQIYDIIITESAD